VQELLGYSSIEMTQKYAHLSPDQMLAAVKRLGSKKNEDHPCYSDACAQVN